MRKVYVDYSATTYIKDEVLQEMLPYYNTYFGNPSSIYEEGILAKEHVLKAREKIANIIKCKTEEIYFTASGTEADNTVLKGIMEANKEKGNHLITTKIEHHAVLNTCKYLEENGYEVTYLNVDNNGRINLNELKNSIKETTVLVSIMAVNNEIGIIQDLESIGEICKEKDIYFHSDCVQAIGNIDINVEKLNLDSISVSAHKFYGPKGIGVMYIKNNIKFNPLIHGGHQEMGKRAGTENVASIVGMSKAMEIATINMKEKVKRLKELRDYLMINITNSIDNVKLNGSLENRVSSNLNICIEDIDCNMMLIELNKNGISASCGSACNSSTKIESHVLKAIGLSSKECFNSIRFSLGEKNTYSDMDYIVYILKNIVKKHKII